MGILNGLKLTWYATVSLLTIKYAVSPVLGLFGLQPIANFLQANVQSLLFLTTTLLIGGLTLVFTVGYAILTGWKAEPKLTRKMRLALSLPAGLAALVLGGAISLVAPLPIIPLVVAALLAWAMLRFLSTQLSTLSGNRSVDVNQAEKLAIRFWKSRNPESRKPVPVGATLDGDQWIVTLAENGKNGQLDLDARTGLVLGWRQNQ